METFVRTFRHHAFFFKHREDGLSWLFNEVNSSDIINEFYTLPADAFLLIFLLFEFEDVIVEVLLEFFVGEIDAKLLEAVEFENFEAEDIENT